MSNVATLPNTDQRALAQQQAQAVTTQGMIFDFETIQNMQRMAEMMAGARVSVPQHLVNNPGDCLAIVMQAAQWQMNPFAVAQKTFVVQGRLGYEAQLINAAVTSSSVLASRINYHFFGPWERVLGKFRVVKRQNEKGKDYEYRVPAWSADDEIGCGVTVSAFLKGEQEPRELTVELVQARTRNSTLWAEDPRQQLSYLAVKKWARLHVPDVILGVYSPDEYEQPVERDMGPAKVVPEDAPATRTDAVKAKLASRRKAAEPPPEVDPTPIIEQMQEAQSLADLEALVNTAKLLTGDARKQAAMAYKVRKQELEATAQPAMSEAVQSVLADITDPETGEDTIADIQAWATDAEMTDAERKQINDALAVRMAA